MSKWFVGQRVRVKMANDSRNIGLTGVITHIGNWKHGDSLPYAGHYLEKSILGADVCCDWDRPSANTGRAYGPAHTSSLEPILYDGAQPSEFSYSELMDNLRTKVQEEV